MSEKKNLRRIIFSTLLTHRKNLFFLSPEKKNYFSFFGFTRKKCLARKMKEKFLGVFFLVGFSWRFLKSSGKYFWWRDYFPCLKLSVVKQSFGRRKTLLIRPIFLIVCFYKSHLDHRRLPHVIKGPNAFMFSSRWVLISACTLNTRHIYCVW